MPLQSCRLLGLAMLLGLSAQCAARNRALTPAESTQLYRADALIRDGCYRCLQEASDIYANLLSNPAGRAPGRVVRGALDVTLLLAVREKELGLPADASLTRARGLLSRMSRTTPETSAQTHAALAIRLQAAQAVVGDLSGLDAEERQRRDEALQQRDAAADTTSRAQGTLEESAATDLTAAYLALAIDCEQPRSRRGIGTDRILAQHGAPALLQYRVAICSTNRPNELTRLREDDPRWIEAAFFEGKYEMGSPARAPEPERAVPLLRAVAEAFPQSIAIHSMLARALEMNGDFARALASFDRILVSNPEHVDARLGRVRNLSYLGRWEEGIAAATLLIDSPTWHVGDAFYWRAWNQYQARRFDLAWTDVQDAMRLVANTAVYALAGSIAYARKDLDAAVQHFDRAVEMDSTNCAAAASAGLAHGDQGAWQLAGDKYAKATSCFARAASTARSDLAKLEQSSLESSLKASRTSTALERVAAAEELSGRSALSAAHSYLNARQTSLALSHLDVAERHPASRTEALALRARIATMR